MTGWLMDIFNLQASSDKRSSSVFERHSAAAGHSADLHRGGHPLLLQRAAQNSGHAQERPAHGAGSHLWTEAEGLLTLHRRHN